MVTLLTVIVMQWSSAWASEAPMLKSENPWQAQVQKRLEQLLDRTSIKASEVGAWVSVENRGNQEMIWALNGDKSFIPASLTKIVTAATALVQFPQGHQFKTSLLSNGKIEGKVLKGDLVLKGGGDSGFVSETMWVLVNDFLRTDVREIQGDLVVDDSLFDREHYSDGRDPERVDRAYDAPVGAMSFNWNSVNIYVRPGAKPGDPVRVYADPESDYFKLRVRGKTVAGSAKAILVSRVDDPNGSEVIDVGGSLGVGAPEQVFYKSITRPAQWSGEHLRSFLLRRGVTVKGGIKVGRAPMGATILAEAKSQPISRAVADMMKFSNNYVAEMLTKSLAVAGGHEPGTMEKGMDVVRAQLGKWGVHRFVMTNPSGLSRRNQFTPEDLHRVLVSVSRDFRIFPEFLAALPIAGVDGTLKSRLRNGPGERWVRAKTGLLQGVVGLAGYAGRADGNVLTFVFVFNGSAKKSEAARDLFDRMAAQLVGQ